MPTIDVDWGNQSTLASWNSNHSHRIPIEQGATQEILYS